MTQGRTVRSRRRTTGALVLGGVTVALALSAPDDLVALVRGTDPATRTVAADLPGPAVEHGASVEDARDVPPGADVPTGGPTVEGRWGAPAERPTGAARVAELRGGWRLEAGAEEAAALGVLAAREWALARSDRPVPGQEQGQGRGAGMVGADVTVALEAVERPGTAYAVVTVLVLAGDLVERVAVPVMFRDAGPTVAGTPWTLPAPTIGAEPLSGVVVGDELLIEAARDALERVGIPGTRLEQLEVTDGWPFIARLDVPSGGHPWLRWHLDRFVVAGLPLDRAVDGT